MAKDLLFEIGAEEIPAGFLPNIIKQLGELATAALAERHIPHGAVKVYATPRRVALLINDVAERGEDVHETHKGPSVSIAYDGDGNPTKAAIGFARGKGLDVSELKVVDGYIFADTTTAGLDTKEVLSALGRFRRAFCTPSTLVGGIVRSRRGASDICQCNKHEREPWTSFPW